MPSKKEKNSSPDYPALGRQCVETSLNGTPCKPLPGLYLVATPIGHLGDITFRALMTLAGADLIACEDTRNSGILLSLFGIKKRTLSYHDHNADERRPEIIKHIKEGKVVALISDAGMPAIADPGFKLVRACQEAGLRIHVIPGANAALTALTSSGLPTDQFYFMGFLPAKSGLRKKQIAALKSMPATLIFYEAPQRLSKTLKDLADILGQERSASIARELTKFYEEIKCGTLGELAVYYKDNKVKGEIVILVGKSEGEKSEDFDLDNLMREKLKHMSLRDAVAAITLETNLSKKKVYSEALAYTKKPNKK